MLEFQNISAGYGTLKVLHDLSLKVFPGQITAIGGVNGCGKSTLLKVATGLLKPTSGQVLLDEEPLDSFSPQGRAQRLAYLPQGRNIPDLTAFRMVLHGRFAYLSFPRQYRKEDMDAARQALAWVGSEDLAERSMTALSGGQRQKIYIAMALAQDTQTILMDEPTTYLDIRARFEVMELARRLAEMGKTVVLVLHDLDLLLRYAHQVVLMENGQIAALGSPHELCENGSVGRIFGVEVEEVSHSQGRQYVFWPKNQ